jgi:hypothetical protein
MKVFTTSNEQESLYGQAGVQNVPETDRREDLTLAPQSDFRYPSPESRLDFALWVSSRWHGNRPRYWRFDTNYQVLFIDARYWAGRRDYPVLRRNIAESWHAIMCNGLGWRRVVAYMIRRARRDLHRTMEVDRSAHTDRRDEANFPMREALMRLRLIEDTAVRMLPRGIEATELSDAIQGVVDLIRQQERLICSGRGSCYCDWLIVV